MQKYGLLIEYEWCTGCHTCEVACKQEYNRPPGENGVHVVKIGPEMMAGKLNQYWFPLPTDNCDLCEHRIKSGGVPSCVKHCTTSCIKFGTIEELVEIAKKTPKAIIWIPK
jgi:Fe-S-cluster-containing dehydrogenase component